MTDVAPTLKQPNPPTLTELLDSLTREILKNLNCIKPCVVVEYSAGGADDIPTAKLRIAFQKVTSIASDGTKTLAEYTELVSVPVFFMGGGGFTMTYPIAPGDEGIVLFNDRNIDNWVHFGAGQAPETGRVHDLSDGIALIGIRSMPRALGNISATAAQLRSDDGQTVIEASPGKIQLIADEVVIHARNKLCYDAGGTGTVIQPTVIDNYTNGVPVNNHAPNPPQVPS